ncbi:hypothetical protein MPSEU_000184000 [Mayamaea pseudoterrestris]|nr:hypothetical protein MPSEU_000184000 [Mayamaea pseudoterrestris]
MRQLLKNIISKRRQIMKLALPISTLLCCHTFASAFQATTTRRQATTSSSRSALFVDRRQFGKALLTGGASIIAGSSLLLPTTPANAQVFFDPAQYGDQELRVGAVDSVRESVRRAILRNPKLAPSFYQLAVLDALSFNAQTQEYGPDGSVLKLVFSSKETDEYTKNLQEASLALLDAEKALRKKTAISLADAIAIGGAEAIESIGGPVLTVQLGRADTPKNGRVTDLPLDLMSGKRSNAEIAAAFKSAGMTEREMTALLTAFMTLERVEKSRTTEDWKQSAKPKFREPGKIGRMSDFKRLTDEDIAQAELDAELEDPDDGWYIADSFGTRDDRFGDRIGKDEISEKTFNKYVIEFNDSLRKKGGDEPTSFGWVGVLLSDSNLPTVQTWVQKYDGSNLSYIKDLSVSYNSLTQLGAVYTGGKYENLLKNKPRKSLNDDDLKLF